MSSQLLRKYIDIIVERESKELDEKWDKETKVSPKKKASIKAKV